MSTVRDFSEQLFNLKQRDSMPDRKMWTEQEDRVLRFLREDRGQQKWSHIARTMDLEFGIGGRTGKQCRQRYHNHLDGSIVSGEWSAEEESRLCRLHNEVGNKWSLIAQNLSGRTDNCVKNHFYSRLRKAVRKLNRIISDEFERSYEQVWMGSLYKILEISEGKFKNNSKYNEDLIDKCVDLKNQLYVLEPLLSRQRGQKQTLYLKQLILELNQFEPKSKKSSKHSKKARDTEVSSSSKAQGEQQVKKEECDDPFYQIFKRVCQEMTVVRSVRS